MLLDIHMCAPPLHLRHALPVFVYAQAHDSQVRRHLGDSDRIAELDAKYLQLLNYVQKKTVANQRDASDSDEGTCTYNSFSFASFCPQAVYVKPTYMRVLINVQVTNLYM